ncbi:MAG: hypothetical protein AB7N80_11455 [Bdellovibrionales bacterium]
MKNIIFALLLVPMWAEAATIKSARTKITVVAVNQNSVLAMKAQQLQPGQWVTLNKAGDGAGFDYSFIESCQPTGCFDTILNYADKGFWLPTLKEIHFLGKGHIAEHKYVHYSEATNKWITDPRPAWACGQVANCYGMGHGFEHSAANPLNGDFYARIQSSSVVYKLNRATGVWSQLPAAPTLEVAIAIEYFPELGGLLMIGTTGSESSGQAHLYRESTGRWERIGTNFPMGAYHNVARYDAVNKIIIFGGGNGSRNLYKINASGQVSAIAQAPIPVRVLENVFTVDPVSGNYLLFGPRGEFYEYNTNQNSWRALSTANVPIFKSNENQMWMRVAIPISTYGVNAFLVEDSGNTRVVLYKHFSR